MSRSKKKKSKRKPEECKDLAKKIDKYSEGDKARITRWAEQSEKKPLKFKKPKASSGDSTVEVQEADKLLGVAKMLEAFGTADPELQNFLLNQVVQTFEGCQSSENYNYEKLAEFCNHAMAILQGIAPRDEVEGMLAVQMVGVHNLAMQTMKRAMITNQTFEGRQVNVNHTTKMLRTFVSQMEALKRYRTGGQQRVTVEHVHVSEGGQAIVGTVSQGVGEDNFKKRG